MHELLWLYCWHFGFRKSNIVHEVDEMHKSQFKLCENNVQKLQISSETTLLRGAQNWSSTLMPMLLFLHR